MRNAVVRFTDFETCGLAGGILWMRANPKEIIKTLSRTPVPKPRWKSSENTRSDAERKIKAAVNIVSQNSMEYQGEQEDGQYQHVHKRCDKLQLRAYSSPMRLITSGTTSL